MNFRYYTQLHTRTHHDEYEYVYRQTSNISGTLVGNKIDDRSNVVGALPVGTAQTTMYIFVLDLSPAFNGLDKDNCKTRRETFKFRELVRHILDIWGYIANTSFM